MTAHELARQLLTLPDHIVTVFAAGESYPVLQVQEFGGEIDIGCGWASLEEDEWEKSK